MGIINRGYEQGRFVSMAGSGIARMRRSQNNLAGKHSVLRQLGIGTNDPEKAMHILSEQTGGALLVERIQTTVNPAAVILRKARGDLDAKVVIADDDNLGDFLIEGYVGANNGYQTLGDFRFEVDGSVTDAAFGAPVRMVMKLSSGSGLVERLRLDSAGNMGIGMNDPATKLTVEGAVTLKEQSAADTDTPDYGQVWVKTATPNQLYFTTDAGNDIQITSGTALASTYSAGDGLDLTGTTFSTDLKSNGGLVIESTELAVDLGASSVTGTLAVGDGGSGQTSYTNGQLLIGNTTGNTLAKATLTAGTGISITNGSGSVTIANTVTDTNTMGSGFVLEDGDGDEVTITENKEVKFVEGTGIDINWTDVSPGSDADPYDLTFTVNLEGTELVSTGETGGSKFLRENGDGTCGWETVSGGGGGGDITAVTIQTDSGSGSKASDTSGSADFILQGDSAGIDVTNSGTTITVALDLNEITAGAVADGDSFVFVDADGSNANKKEAIADLATLFAGDGITASSSVLAVNVDDSTIETNSDAIRIKDDGVTYAKIQNVSADERILGRVSGANGVIEELDKAAVLTMLNVADGATAGGEANESSFKTISVSGQSDVVADQDDDTLTFAQAGGITLTTTAASDTVTISSADTNTQLTQEQVEDYAGALVASGGTKTGISVTYQDGTGDMDFAVSDLTVAGDSGSTGMTPGDTLTIAGGTGNATAMSGDTLTITCNLEGTELISTGEGGGSKFLREDGDGTCSWQTASGGAITALNSASANRLVTVGSTTTELDAESQLSFTQDYRFLYYSTTDDKPPRFELKHAFDDTTGSEIRFTLDKGAAGLDNDVIGIISFWGDDDNQGNSSFAKIEGIVADASQGAEGGRLTLSVASHDGELNQGLVIQDGDAEDEVDVTIGNGTASVVTIPGHIDLAGDIDVGGTPVLELDSDKVVEFKIAEIADSGSDYNYDSKVLKIKVNGTEYFLQLYAEAGGNGGGMP
jgi:hypothetical protein